MHMHVTYIFPHGSRATSIVSYAVSDDCQRIDEIDPINLHLIFKLYN